MDVEFCGHVVQAQFNFWIDTTLKSFSDKANMIMAAKMARMNSPLVAELFSGFPGCRLNYQGTVATF